MNQKNIREYIRALEHITSFLRSVLEEENKVFPKEERDRLSEITELRMLAKSDIWPSAVPQDLICGESEDDKFSRAAGIIEDFISTNLKDRTFLDFGCGEGHIPYVAINGYETKKSVGYDVKNQDWSHFENRESLIYTTDWEKVKENGPYDIILANDVLDHTKDPHKELKKIQEVKTPQLGKVFLRVHPWTSRHGTHLYKQLNKAYLHLVFTKEELYSMGLEEMETIELIDPIKTYRKMIKDVGFTIIKEDAITQPVDLFFTHTKEVLRRIKSKWANSDNENFASGELFPRDILEIQFIDFILI
jgi:2-polyprenyl-3-methyl-5-hydroxy-6-metoxy-1,4-benzoquinol methylase